MNAQREVLAAAGVAGPVFVSVGTAEKLQKCVVVAAASGRRVYIYVCMNVCSGSTRSTPTRDPS